MDSSGWIQTYTGRQFWPLNPRPQDVCLTDIAHALAGKGRFGNHTTPDHVYSVAQHSILVSGRVPPDLALLGLMHDAAEAYLPDLQRPIKKDVYFLVRTADGEHHFEPFDAVEKRILDAIAFALDIKRLGVKNYIVKDADNRTCMTEKRDVMGPPPADWVPLIQYDGTAATAYPDMHIRAMVPSVAEVAFLHRYRELVNGPVDLEGKL